MCGIGADESTESWHTISPSVPPCCISLAAPEETRVAGAWLELWQTERKGMPPDKEINMNPNYWMLPASCSELNREGQAWAKGATSKLPLLREHLHNSYEHSGTLRVMLTLTLKSHQS